MKHLFLNDVLENRGLKNGIIDAMKSGAVFIYPTDTVYGLGCDAGNRESVAKVREIKQTQHPFSVIAPSKSWIRDKLAVKDPGYLKKLPGPFTLVFKKRKKGTLSAASVGDSLGVRIPRHPFSSIVSAAGVPFITTSANISGQPAMKSIKDMPDPMLYRIDFVIDGGSLAGKASTVIDLTKSKPKILRK